MKAKVTDNYGVAASASATVTVSGVTRTLVMTSPTANSIIVGQIHVTGYATSPTGIDALQVYIDNVLTYQVKSSTIDTFIAVGTGTHRVVLKAWDVNSSSWMQKVNVTVK